MATAVQKHCLSCGLDVSQTRRVKDQYGRYYCHPCWSLKQERMSADARAEAPSHLPEQTLSVSPDDIESDRSAIPADKLTRRQTMVIASIVLAGVILTSTLVYFLFLRNWWESHNKETLLALKAQAESLHHSGQLIEAKTKYDEMFTLLADHAINDQDLQGALTTARDDEGRIVIALAAKQQAERDQREKEERQKLAEAEQNKKSTGADESNGSDSSKKTSSDEDIWTAALLGDTDRVREVLRIAPIEANDYGHDVDGHPPLFDAANKELALLLIANGANVNAKDGLGRTAIDSAAVSNKTDVISVLLDHGASITPCVLYDAVHGQSITSDPDMMKTVKLLVQRGADINALDPDHANNKRLLEDAAWEGKLSDVQFLIHLGADPSLENDDHLTPYQVAALRGNKDVADYLERLAKKKP